MIKKMLNRYFTGMLIMGSISVTHSQQLIHPSIVSSTMKNVHLNNKGELSIQPTASSSSSDFNFLVGTHRVHHKKLTSRLTNSHEWIEFEGIHTQELILEGIGNLEQHRMMTLDGKMVEGMALRLFDPETKIWSIHWADSRTGKLDAAMKGSFENNIGYFFATDMYNGHPILVQFKWDASDPLKPIWSQAFSTDQGKTWEWNWYMHFSKTDLPFDSWKPETEQEKKPDEVGIIELRNYVLKPGKRDAFISYFEDHFISSQEELNAFPLGQYRMKESENHFFWIRGFENMKSRSEFLPAFYYSDFWKAHRNTANAMIANNDHVHLLHPLELKGDSLIPTSGIKKECLYPKNRIGVVEFYTANNKLNQLKNIMAKHYIPLLQACDIKSFTIWEAELKENDFPRLPVFQDKNLLVIIGFYDSEDDYRKKVKLAESKMNTELQDELADAVTFKNTIILYPTEKTIKR